MLRGKFANATQVSSWKSRNIKNEPNNTTYTPYMMA